jgi:hypothetical protein
MGNGEDEPPKKRHLRLVKGAGEQPDIPDDSVVETTQETFLNTLQKVVEIPDLIERRDAVESVYALAAHSGLTIEEINSLYKKALENMQRPRGSFDEIEIATSELTGEQEQLWPPDYKKLEGLGGQAPNHLQSKPEDDKPDPPV